MSNLGIGIIGCGNIATAYLELAQLFSSIEVRALADINHAAAVQKSEEFMAAQKELKRSLGQGILM